MSAIAHLRGKLQLDDLNMEHNFGEIESFSQSKLALTMFTKQMAFLLKRKLGFKFIKIVKMGILDTKMTFTAVNPGLVRGTGHLNGSKLTKSLLTKLSVWPWMWLFMKSPLQGCQTVVYAAVEPSLNNVSGCYMKYLI